MTKTCSHGPKQAYRSIEEAKRVRGLVSRRKKGLRIYRCPNCGMFHLTKEKR